MIQGLHGIRVAEFEGTSDLVQLPCSKQVHLEQGFLIQPGCCLLFCCKDTLLIHGHLPVHQVPQFYFVFWQAALQLLGPQPVLVEGVIAPQVQDLATLIVEHHDILVGNTNIWCIDQSSQFCIFCKIPVGVCCPSLQIINEDVKQ